MKRGHYIVTNFDYPPIPDRSMDWSAHLRDYDGAPDASGPNTFIGRGPTETAAVADLLEQLDACDATPHDAIADSPGQVQP